MLLIKKHGLMFMFCFWKSRRAQKKLFFY